MAQRKTTRPTARGVTWDEGRQRYRISVGFRGQMVQEHAGANFEAAKRRAAQIRRDLRAGVYQKPSETRPDALTVALWVDEWEKAQEARTRVPRTLHDMTARLRHHVVPVLGERLVEDLTADDLRELFAELRVRPSEATGRPVSATTAARVSEDLRGLLARAEVHLQKLGVHWLTPYRALEPGDAPQPKKNPRDYYRRHEVESLISDPRIPEDRRVLWTLLFCTGMRHDEAAGLRWRDIDWAVEPLPMITLREQAGGRPLKEDKRREGLRRVFPMHPTLRDALEAWKREGWVRNHGRRPGPEDYVCPRPTDPRKYRAVRSTLKQIRRDARTVGAVARSTHETRNTFETLAIEDSPELESAIVAITHQKKIHGAADGYIRTRYLAQCTAMEAYRVRLPKANVVALPVAVGAESTLTRHLTPEGRKKKTPSEEGVFQRGGRDSNPSLDRGETEITGKSAKQAADTDPSDQVVSGPPGAVLDTCQVLPTSPHPSRDPVDWALECMRREHIGRALTAVREPDEDDEGDDVG